MEALKSAQALKQLEFTFDKPKTQSENIKTYVKEAIKEETQDSNKIKDDLKNVIKALNNTPLLNDKLNFGFSDEAEMLMVQIKDRQTDKLIRQFPTEDFINRLLYYRDNIGVLFDEVQ